MYAYEFLHCLRVIMPYLFLNNRRSREEYQEISDPVSVETQEKHDDSIL